MSLSRVTAMCIVSCLASAAAGAVSVADVFSDHVVLQRELPIAVWGWGDAGEALTVQLGDGAMVQGHVAANGTWRVQLPASAAGGPYTLVVTGKNTLRINDVVVGEVWLCSGQSNMELPVSSCLNFPAERVAATDPLIRLLGVPHRPAAHPEARAAVSWSVCSPDTVSWYSAAGYFMARELRKQLGVPVGLLHASWGGTRIEPWTPAAGFALSPKLTNIVKQLAALDLHDPAVQARYAEHLAKVEAWTAATKTALAQGTAVSDPPDLPVELQSLTKRPDPQQQPTTLYNGMLAPLVGFTMRGAIWYQGESNHDEGALYTDKMQAMIGGWRQVWGLGDFPVHFVQIAPFQYWGEDPQILPRFWAAQAAAARIIPHTAMVVTNDIGEATDIHPKNKQEVGRRLALLALNRTYGHANLVCEGPVFQELKPEGTTLRVLFTPGTSAGLKTRDGAAPTWFEIAGEEGEFSSAEAVINGTSVVLSSPKVAKPVAARFAWSRNTTPNLVNGAGLPAGAFSAGDFSSFDPLTKIADAKGYVPVYALDLAHLGHDITYDLNASASTPAFDRIAYLLELQADGRPRQFTWVSMDAFTSNAKLIGIPTLASGAAFQCTVANLVVTTNVPGLDNGPAATGNIEFWPNNYAQANGNSVPGASDTDFDFGDLKADPLDGYGCMQVHIPAAKQTVFALNHWPAGATADIGIGNNQTGNADWTFANNAGSWTVKQLRVFVRPKK